MSAAVVFQQMVVIFFLVMLGVISYHKKWINVDTSRSLSALIVNITNPCLLITSAITAENKVSGRLLLMGMLSAIVVYAVLLLCSLVIPHILRIDHSEHYAYKMLTVYGNTGFIGIPLASAVIGPECLIYVAMHNLIFNFLIYTHGYKLIRSAAKNQLPPEEAAALLDTAPGGVLSTLKNFINVGTLSSILTVILYLMDLKVPTVINDTFLYSGRATTYLSMTVLGISVATMNLKEIFRQKKLYVFAALRFLLIPIVCLFALRSFITDPMILGVCALMLSVPCANMPLMLSKEYHLDETVIASAIILTTLLSLITIPVVTLFVG